MPGPIESRNLLMDHIRQCGRITLIEAHNFEKRENLWFGPGVSVIDVLIEKEALGVVEYVEKSKAFRLAQPGKQLVPVFDM